MKAKYNLPFKEDYAFVYDVETSGLNSKKDKLIQLAGVLFKKNDDGTYCTEKLINEYVHHPGLRLSEFIVNLTGITDETLRSDGIEEDEFKKMLKEIFDGKNIVFSAHNAQFDQGFLNEFVGYELVKNPFCTLEFFKELKRKTFIEEHIDRFGGVYNGHHSANIYINEGMNPGKHKYLFKGELKLENLQKKFGLTHTVTHNAMDDVIVLVKLLQYISSNLLD